MNNYIPRILTKRTDGGKDSKVFAYFLIEWKPFFSICLLNFGMDSLRRNYHSHAFNAITWWLKGEVVEETVKFSCHEDGCDPIYFQKTFKPSLTPKFTRRNKMHKVIPQKPNWAISFRGPWLNEWDEFDPDTNKTTTLTYGRKVVK